MSDSDKPALVMARTYEMITVGSYRPLAGFGTNTIRKMAGKYRKVAPGDIVIMRYVTDPLPGAPSHGEEVLKVASVAILPSLDAVLEHHYRRNHSNLSKPELRAVLEKVYNGDVDGEWLAIYFR